MGRRWKALVASAWVCGFTACNATSVAPTDTAPAGSEVDVAPSETTPAGCVVDGVFHANGSQWQVGDGCPCNDVGIAICTTSWCSDGGVISNNISTVCEPIAFDTTPDSSTDAESTLDADASDAESAVDAAAN